jgi:hypothetical protein
MQLIVVQLSAPRPLLGKSATLSRSIDDTLREGIGSRLGLDDDL